MPSRPIEFQAAHGRIRMRSEPSPAGIVAGTFFLIWAAIFLTWMPVETLRLITGIVFVLVGVALILRNLMRSRSAKLRRSVAIFEDD